MGKGAEIGLTLVAGMFQALLIGLYAGVAIAAGFGVDAFVNEPASAWFAVGIGGGLKFLESLLRVVKTIFPGV